MKFVSPPPTKLKGNSDHWVQVVEELKKNPNEWGLAGNYSIGVSTHIKKGRYKAFYPEGTHMPMVYVAQNWEITTRTNGNNRVDIYIRWVE